LTELTPVLAGTRILVTAQRRSDELAGALIRRGADVVVAPTLGVVPHIDEDTLIRRTREVLESGVDTVVVTTGKYKGKTGKITATHPRENKVTVEGINIVKKHVKPNRTYPQGGIIEMTKPIWVSKVAVVDPTTKKPTRIGLKVDDKGVKTRIYKASGKEIK